MSTLKAPFPAFGGKSKIAPTVWRLLGDVRNYIEPFAFSAAMLLKRPAPGPVETINDLNAFVANFWRAVQADPEGVARHVDWPVNETDLHARHRWLVRSDAATAKLEKVRRDPEAYDIKIAGWWCWGVCCWIGSGWCEDGRDSDPRRQVPVLSDCGKGCLGGITQKLPYLDPTHGVIGSRPEERIWEGRGTALQRPRPVTLINAGDGETCAQRRAWLVEWMMRLADRLRSVRVCCGHWARICNSDSTLTRLGLTGVFLDPPYRQTIDGQQNRAAHIYANDRSQDVDALCDEVEAWCLRWGDDPQIRIVLCGLEGEYPELTEARGWRVMPWKSNGGYGNRTERGKANAARERLWINAACVESTRHLFSEATA